MEIVRSYKQHQCKIKGRSKKAVAIESSVTINCKPELEKFINILCYKFAVTVTFLMLCINFHAVITKVYNYCKNKQGKVMKSMAVKKRDDLISL